MTDSTIFSRWTARVLAGFFSLALLALVYPTNASAQETQGSELEECAGGTLFYVAFPDTTTNTQDGRFLDDEPESFVLMLYSPVDQNVTVGRPGGAGLTVSLSANEILEFDTKDVAVPLVTTINTAERNKVLKVEGQFPLVVYGYMSSTFGCHGYTAIPVEAWGTEYYAATWQGDQIRNVYPAGETNYDASERKEAPAMITIIAAYDNTKVTISPTGGLAQCNNCQSVTLNEGEVYQVHSFVDLGDVENQEDIAGSYIFATKRIGVLSGNTRTQIEAPFSFPMLAGNSPKDQTAEWLAPIDQHGTEFVFMPTWDKLRQAPGNDPIRDKEYVRVYPTVENQTEMVRLNSAGQRVPLTTPVGDPQQFSHESIGDAGNAIPYFTSDPGQAYQSPRSVAEFNGTTGSGNFIGASFNAWGTYMVELTPREQWTSFAPFRAPTVLSSMQHFVNIVTDTNNRFNVFLKQGTSPRTLILFPREIPGTDLVWGTLTINPGTTYIIEADSGGTFGGFGYGLYEDGFELYRPGEAKKDDDGKGISAAGGGGEGDLPSILHPSEYEENVGHMYGMPLAPSRCVLLPPDEYEVEVTQDCEEMLITIRAKNDRPAGIKFIRLLIDPDSTFNARLEPVNPSTFRELRERAVTEVTVRITAINELQNAKAVLEFKDRTREGEIQRVRYDYQAERVDLDPSDILDFGSLTIDQAAGEQPIMITNPLTRDVVVKSLDLAFANRNFVIVRTEPPFDWTNPNDSIILKPGESMQVFIDITPTDANRVYEDSLVVELGCVTVRLPLRAATVQPCLFVSDLAFGTLGINESKTLPLEICNTGDGFVTFHDSTANSPGGEFLSWLDMHFDVPQPDLDRLGLARLGPGDCITINVTFTSDTNTGNYRTVGRFWASTRDCRDTSVWTARVTKPGPGIEGYDFKENWLSVESGCTKNSEIEYTIVKQITNNGDSPFTIDDVRIVDDPDGVFAVSWVGNIRGRQVNPNNAIDITIHFKPMAVKDYDGNISQIRMWFTSNGVQDSLSDDVQGEGIESYVTVEDMDFGRIQFTTAGATTVTEQIRINSTGNRPVTITNMSINGADGGDFQPTITLISPNTGPAPATGPAITLAPGVEQIVEVTYDPQDTDPTDKVATLDLEGDFAYAECSESDSSGALTGAVFTLGASIDNYDFGSILTCFEEDGQLTVTNTGLDPVLVTAVTGPDPDDQYLTIDNDFLLNINANPVQLAAAGTPGESLTIPVHFAPALPGDYSADVTVTIENIDRTTVIETLVGNVRGNGRTITITLGIDDIPPTFPGLRIDDVAVLLTGEGAPNDPAAAMISDFRFTVQYDPGMMRVTGTPELGDLFPASQGWQLEVLDRAPGYVSVRIWNDDPSVVISGDGQALLLDFITFIGESTESTLEPEAIILGVYGENNNDCVNFVYVPGTTALDEVCGLDFRLIEAASGAKYSLADASPNITSDRTEIAFSIGIEAMTTIEIFDQSGNRVGLLVSEELTPGGYAVSWDVEAVSSGKYFYKITSGPWTETKEVIVRK